jgi:hypothetical protein
MPDFEGEGGLSGDFFDLSTDQSGGIGSEDAQTDPLDSIEPESVFDSDSGDFDQMDSGDSAEDSGDNGNEMPTEQTDSGEQTTEGSPGGGGGDKAPKQPDPIQAVTTGLGVLKNVLESLAKNKAESKPKEPTKSDPPKSAPGPALPYPVQLDDIPVTVPTSGKKPAATPAKASSPVDQTLNRVRAALARTRRNTKQ